MQIWEFTLVANVSLGQDDVHGQAHRIDAAWG
jgi:hypothetical protein